MALEVLKFEAVFSDSFYMTSPPCGCSQDGLCSANTKFHNDVPWDGSVLILFARYLGVLTL